MLVGTVKTPLPKMSRRLGFRTRRRLPSLEELLQIGPCKLSFVSKAGPVFELNFPIIILDHIEYTVSALVMKESYLFKSVETTPPVRL